MNNYLLDREIRQSGDVKKDVQQLYEHIRWMEEQINFILTLIYKQQADTSATAAETAQMAEQHTLEIADLDRRVRALEQA